MTHKEYASYLRKVANFFEEHTEIDIPHDEVGVFAYDGLANARKIIASLGECKKEYSASLLRISKDFGGRDLKFVLNRSSVCERRVIGKRFVEEVPAYEVDVVEWECKPLLKAEEEEL